MEHLIKTTLIGLFFGTFGTTIGGILGVKMKLTSNRILSFILEFAAGLMVSIVCFELIPEAMELMNIVNVLVGVLLGVISMILCDNLLHSQHYKKQFKSSLLKTGVLVGIGLAIHNFPEGIAIGSGFGVSFQLGISLATAILLHDIPEGISMSVPMKSGGMESKKVLIYTILSGVTTGIGAFFGALLGTISNGVIAFCLAFAAGTMLYIASAELVPESNKLYKGRFASIGNILGFILGILSTKL